MRKEIQYSELRTELKIEESERRIDERAREYRDEVLTRMDGVVGELDQHREDNTFRDNDIRILKDQSADHEKRLNHLESVNKN